MIGNIFFLYFGSKFAKINLCVLTNEINFDVA
jgi:hypothetical protein